MGENRCCPRRRVQGTPTARVGVARAVLIAAYIAVLVGSPILVYEFLRRSNASGASVWRAIFWLVGLLALLLTLPISISDIISHLLAFRRPLLQKQVVRLLFLPVMFGACALIGLVFPEASLVAETVRDGYEALGIYFFTSFLIDAADGDAALSARLRMKPASAGAHLPPMSMCLRPWPLGSGFLRRCKAGVLQYVVMRIALTAAMLVLHAQGLYAEGDFRIDRGYLYVTILANCSQLVAVYCLLLLLQAAHEELTPMRAWPKLLCVKAVIFFAWWQGVALAVLVQLGLMPSTLDISEQEVAKGLQNLLIVLEMLPAALAHRWAFPVSDFAPPERGVWGGEAEDGDESIQSLEEEEEEKGTGKGKGTAKKKKKTTTMTRSKKQPQRRGGRYGPAGRQAARSVGPRRAVARKGAGTGSVRSTSDSDDSRHIPRLLAPDDDDDDAVGLLDDGNGDDDAGVELVEVNDQRSAYENKDGLAVGGIEKQHRHGSKSKGRGVFAAMLESALPMDVVTDIRRTVLPTPTKPASQRRGMGADKVKRRSRGSSLGDPVVVSHTSRRDEDAHGGAMPSRAGASVQRDLSISSRASGQVTGSAGKVDTSDEEEGGDDEEMLLHAAQEYSRRMHTGQTGGSGLLAVAARRLPRPRHGGGRGRGRGTRSGGRGVDAINAKHMADAAVSSMSEARVVQAQASPGTAASVQLHNLPQLIHGLPDSALGVIPGIENHSSTMASNRVKR